jgi:hypothetical protein
VIPKGIAQEIHYLAWNTATNEPEPGDAANHTLQAITDGIINPAANGGANMGVLNSALFTAAEMAGNSVALAGISSTPGVVIIPVIIITDAPSIGIPIFIPFTVWNKTTNGPELGDLANLSISFAADGVSGAIAGGSLVELSQADAPGLYGANLTVLQNAGVFMSVFGTSGTADVNVLPTSYSTDPGRITSNFLLPRKVIKQPGRRIIRRRSA